MTTKPSTTPRSALHARWAALGPRERLGVGAAALVVLAAVLWTFALAPALAVWREAPARQAALDARAQRMQALAAEAQALRQQPKASREQALRALQQLVQAHAAAVQLSVVDDRATLTLRGLDAAALADLLARARMDARALPVQAQLTRATTAGEPPAPAAPARWNGTLVLSLPAP